MSYARFSPDSDVYVYMSGDGVFTCCGCKLKDYDLNPMWDYGGSRILDHLQEHIEAGHKVPQYCIEAIKEELEQEWVR
jgi:hypothetical protein